MGGHNDLVLGICEKNSRVYLSFLLLVNIFTEKHLEGWLFQEKIAKLNENLSQHFN